MLRCGLRIYPIHQWWLCGSVRSGGSLSQHLPISPAIRALPNLKYLETADHRHDSNSAGTHGAFPQHPERRWRARYISRRVIVVNSVRAAVASASEGHGVTRLLSDQVAAHLRDGRLRIVLSSAELPPLPVHIVTPERRLSVPKVRAFVDFAVPRLRTQFARLV